MLTLNPRKCRHPDALVAQEYTAEVAHWFRAEVLVSRKELPARPTDRLRVACGRCGFETVYSSVEQAPRWVQRLWAKAERAPA